MNIAHNNYYKIQVLDLKSNLKTKSKNKMVFFTFLKNNILALSPVFAYVIQLTCNRTLT